MINNQQMFRVFNQNIRKISIEVSIYNLQGYLVGYLKGYTTSGNINLTSNNAYRRSGSVELVVKDEKITTDSKSVFWFWY